MSFKRFFENQIVDEEVVLSVDNIGYYESDNDNIIAIYDAEKLKNGLDEYDMENMLSSVLAVMVYNKNVEMKSVYEVHKVSAKQNYGPLIYLLGMQKVKQFKSGLTAYHEPSYVSEEAKTIWKNFYDGKGKYLVKKIKLKKQVHKEEYLKYMYTNINNYDLSDNKNITSVMLKDDKYGEKKDLMLEVFVSFVEQSMRNVYQ